ncbi:MAG: hypothetical protein ABL993_02585 [Vicinamibacterales bacterium]
MSLTTTAKGRYDLKVNGVHFSYHNVEREAVAERASAILEAQPTAVVTVLPPTIEVRASDAAIVVPPTVPVVSDGGIDLIDFIAGHTVEPQRNPNPLVGDLFSVLQAFADNCKQDWLLHRLYFTLQDGSEMWAGVGWRGYTLLFYLRDKNALKVGSKP